MSNKWWWTMITAWVVIMVFTLTGGWANSQIDKEVVWSWQKNVSDVCLIFIGAAVTVVVCLKCWSDTPPKAGFDDASICLRTQIFSIIADGEVRQLISDRQLLPPGILDYQLRLKAAYEQELGATSSTAVPSERIVAMKKAVKKVLAS